MVNLSPDPTNDIEEYGNFSDDELAEIRSVVKDKIQTVIEEEIETNEFDIMKNGGLVDKPVHQATAGETIVYWPNDIDAAVSDFSNVDTSELRRYFQQGNGVGFVVK